ncbi:gastrotropin-like [Physella acuta]|uniref:gastrotropin-like n=1 Tax=Physella acuta TaxID=109671 RepID=UPI0027DC1150|nr:gastrotropin-like [Physella acuta]
MDAFLGKWQLDRSRDQGVETYLQMGAYPADMVEKYKSHGVTLEISRQGNKYCYTHTCEGLPDTANVFELGKETFFEVPGGEKFKGTITIDGNKIRENATYTQGLVMEGVKEIVNNELKSVTTSSAGVMTQFFKRC